MACQAPSAGQEPAERAVAELDGKAIVTERDIADWRATQACYAAGAPGNASREAAFMRLLEAAIAEAALRSQGGARPTVADLRRESARIDRETRRPDVLACVKSRFGQDRQRYLRVFVRPSWVESRLRAHLRPKKQTQEQWFQALPRMRLRILDPDLRRWTLGVYGNPRLPAVEILP